MWHIVNITNFQWLCSLKVYGAHIARHYLKARMRGRSIQVRYAYISNRTMVIG